jgi:hypothetical protein
MLSLTPPESAKVKFRTPKFLESLLMVKFPCRKRASDFEGGRFWRLKIAMRAAHEALGARSGTHALEQIARKNAVSPSSRRINPVIVEESDSVIADRSILTV